MMKGERVASMRASRVILLVEAIALHCRLRNYRLTTGNVSLLLLDEPFEGLAPLIVQDLLGICRRLADEGRTIVIVEQNVEAALSLSHRCYILNNGHVVYEGTPRDLRGDPDFMHRHLGI